MAKLSEEIIEEFVRQKLEGKSYTLIRTDLGDRGLNKEEVRETIKKIDDRVLIAEMSKQHHSKSRLLYRTGLILAVLGLIMTIASNSFILTNLPKYVIYSPFFAGILLMLYGRMLRRKPPVLYEKGPGQIKRKRTYR